MKLPPGPSLTEKIPLLLERKKNALSFYRTLVNRFGEIVYFKIGGSKYCLIDSPDLIKHVLQENHKNYVKGPGYERLREIIGDGLLTSEGEVWRSQRKLAQPAFHKEKIEKLSSTVAEITQELVADWKARTPGKLDIAQEMTTLTLEIAGKTLLGTNPKSKALVVAQAVSKALKIADARGASWLRILDFVIPFRKNVSLAVQKRLPTKSNLEFKAAMATLDEIVYSIIGERRREKEHHLDLLSMFMDAKDEETGEVMSDKLLRDEVMSIFLAGHETTATALTWSLYCLASDAALCEVLREENKILLGDRIPTLGDLARLPKTQAFFDEVLRYYPPFWRFTRQAKENDRLGEYEIPAGTVVMISPYVTHRNSKFWSNPETFSPTRFLETPMKNIHRFAYIPFGGGPRICIGNTFALMEAQIILSILIRSFKFGISGTAPEFDPHITLRPKSGMHLTVERVA